jgi:membrane-associated protease RseP (regulator of RpoE activity)
VIDAAAQGGVDLVLETPSGPRRVRVPFAAPPTERLAWERLGIRATEVTPDVRAKTNYPAGSGILVTEVRDGSPAARVGLQPGDLLVAFGEQPLTVEEDLLGFVQTAAKNEVTQVTLVRPERTRFGVRLERYKAKLQVE